MTNLRTAAARIKSFFTGTNTEEARELRERTRIGKGKKHNHKKRNANNELRIAPSGLKFQFLRFVSVMMIMSLLVTSNPAAPGIVYSSAGEVGQDIRYSFLSNFGSIQNFSSYNPVLGLFYKLTKRTKKQQRVAKIEIVPGNAAIREGEKIHFSCVAYDSSGNIVQGAECEWLGWNTEKRETEAPLAVKGGVFEAEGPGVYYVGAKVGGMIGTKRIVVREDLGFRAAKEIRRQEMEAAEAKTGISTGIKKQQNLRKEVLDEVARMKANPSPSISNSTKMRKADKAKLKKWDDAQKVKRRAARDKAKQRRHLKTSRVQAKNVKAKDGQSSDDSDDEESRKRSTAKKVKFVNSRFSSDDEVPSGPRSVDSPVVDEGSIEEGVSKNATKKAKSKTTKKPRETKNFEIKRDKETNCFCKRDASWSKWFKSSLWVNLLSIS